ncbi:MAG TPA: ATP-binding protein [Devosia sp.]|jgi:two-component system C4-dicarboxylate transport sensor histidine kinase DctB|nr:ATP-binding protein [Devosia sp.]
MHRRYAIAALFAALVAVTAGSAWFLARQQGVERLESQVRDRLTINMRAVDSEIERYRYLPAVISQDRRITELLANEAEAGHAVANHYLQAVRTMSGADELYVLDLAGNTLAASKWDEPGSFVGHNYAFRPYFTDAIATGSGRFYAVGVTTGRPGYFLSSRVEQAGRTLGVVVAKVDMSPLARTWAEAGDLTAVADKDGIVFLSGEPRWLYRPLYPLAPDTLRLLSEERRYDGVDLARAEPLTAVRAGDAGDLSIRVGRDDYLLGQRSVEPDGWQLLSALPLGPVEAEARLVSGSAALLAMLTLAIGLFLRQRQQLTRFKLEQNAVLERHVAERTVALAHEIEERKRAEQDLRTMQESLIHAAKLAALGRMSAAIVHEVSQPLSALDNTLAAAGLHAERQATGEVQRNLTSARSLLKRMQRTVKHLKTFSSRRDSTPPEAVDVNLAIEAAIEIVAPRAREHDVTIAFRPAPALQPVRGNAIRLEQVLINLLMNAVDATAAAGESDVAVSAQPEDGRMRITVSDMGGGISEEARERLFEPFFTTKTTGEGLGLGLSISRTIIEEFGGALTLAPHPGGGTRASVELPLHVPRTNPVPVPA